MFTGLVREMAEVKSFNNGFLKVKAEYVPKIGDSVAINGACLTVVKVEPNHFTVELSPESTAVLAMENYKDKVHIEPAMQMGDRFEGHIVQGHVDTVGVVEAIESNGNSYDVFIAIDNEFKKYLIPKGSITVDGISLTINEVTKTGIRLTIIPHTMKETLFATYQSKSRVNIETDMFARYIYNLMANKNGLTWDDVDQAHFMY